MAYTNDRRMNGLILFTKVPRPGFVKTRLIAREGSPTPEEVASLYQALLEDTLAVLKDLKVAGRTALFVSFEPKEEEDKIRSIVSGYIEDADYLPQITGTVTDKVNQAFQGVLASGCEAVCLIPGDHADLDADLLAHAFDRLSDPAPSIVIGPTSDGGAYLLGFNRASFGAIRFDLENTHLVCADIFLKARTAGIKCTFLENRDDIDDLDDARYFRKRTDLRNRRTWTILQDMALPPTEGNPDTKVSVIVPTLNEGHTIGGLLNSLQRQEKNGFEVIVADGVSKDETVSKAWGRADKIVFVPKPSRSGQENLAASDARGDSLLFLHADMTVPSTLLGSVIASMRDQTVAGGSCHVLFRGGGTRIGFLNAVRLTGDRLGIHGISSGFYVRRQVFDALGGFRTNVMEEAVDFQRRAARLGKFVTLKETCTTSARRFRREGSFLPTFVIWVTTIVLTEFGLHLTFIEKRLWRNVR